jgi:hypothetical protein
MILEELRNEVEKRNIEIIHNSEVFAQGQRATIQELAESKLMVRDQKFKLMENERTIQENERTIQENESTIQEKECTIQELKEYTRQLENELGFYKD